MRYICCLLQEISCKKMSVVLRMKVSYEILVCFMYLCFFYLFPKFMWYII